MMFFSSLQSLESSTEEKQAWRKHNAWNAVHATNLPFAADKAATLFSLVWPWTVMNPASAQRSPSSEKMAFWFASPTFFCWMKSMCTADVDAGALWDCLLTSRILRLVMRAGFQPATSLLFLKHDWHQSSSETSFTVREAGSIHGSSVCQEHFGPWGKITLA